MVPKSMAMYSWTYAENDCQEMYNCERKKEEKRKEKKDEYKGGGQRKNKLKA